MFKIYPFRPRSLIGLDLQPDAARLVELKKTRHGHQIERMTMLPIPAGYFAAGKIQQWEKVSAVLAEWFERLGVMQQPAVISLPMNAVRTQRILLPASLNETNILSEIMLHLQQEMPGLHEPLSIDFSVLPHKLAGYHDVLFTAVREMYLTTYVECIHQAGLQVKMVDVDLYALMRAVNGLQNTFALLQVKNTLTELIVFSQHEVIFHRQWETAQVDQWVQHLDNNIQLLFALPNKPALEKIVICGIDAYCHAAALCLSVYNVLIEQKRLEVEPAFLVAYGLAMRELSPW